MLGSVGNFVLSVWKTFLRYKGFLGSTESEAEPNEQ